MQTHRYCIIGAGAAGLAALKEMRDGGFNVDCFEKSARVGGHWNTDYDALHTITPRDSSGFDDFPMPKDYPLYPSREQVTAYLNAYADHFKLREHIQFNNEVTSITPLDKDGESGWQVHLSNGQNLEYAGVLVANGHLWDAKIPPIAQKFSGKSIHSGHYHNTFDIEGKVLVVGFGNSGCDLAVDAAQARLNTSISIHRGQLFQPKTLFGMPRTELAFLNQLAPAQQNALLNTLILASLGNHDQYPGLPAPETYDLEQQPPVVNELLLYWIQHGRIKVRPGIQDINGKEVLFTDGRSETFDTILWATGFNVCLPFLDKSLLQWQNHVPLRTAGLVLPTTPESLYFIGLAAPRGPQWPTYNVQTKLVKKMLRLRESGVSGLAKTFARLQVADNRIDIVRRIWQENVELTQAQLDTLAVTNKVNTADTLTA